jgi:DNA-binding IclR family transcriptional regulator
VEALTEYPVPCDALASRGLLARAIGLLRVIADHGSASLPELAVATGLPKSSVHRLARELVREGVLVQRANRYAVAPLVFEFGASSPHLKQLREAALPIMEDIYEFTHSVVHLVILIEEAGMAQGLILDKILGRKSPSTGSQVGLRIPLHSTASGKVLLAFSAPHVLDMICASPLIGCGPNPVLSGDALRMEVERIRRNRIAIDDVEGSKGIRCVAAPIFAPGEGLCGALSITTKGPADFQDLGTIVSMGARAVSRELLRSEAKVG